jgi:hypothetical protein
LTKAKETRSGGSSPRRYGIRVIGEPTGAELTERQISDYRTHREKFIKWILNLGKDPERGEGYAETTANVFDILVPESTTEKRASWELFSFAVLEAERVQVVMSPWPLLETI